MLFPGRLRLLLKLEVSCHPVIAISAPAGYGKSVVSERFALGAQQVHRVRCTSPHEARRTASAVRTMMNDPTPVDSVTIVDRVEDFRNDAIATKLLVDAASAATADRALVLQSRVRLPESLRATLEATGGRLVTVNDLRLDREDVYAVFEGRLSAADCAQVAESATGWPVAVLGLCNSTQPRNIAAGICGEDIQKILASEVLPFLPATVTNALTFLAMEVRGDDEELSIASGADDTADLLESLAAVPFVRHENIWELLSPLREIVVAQYGARGCATAARQVAFASHAARSARRRGHATDC